MGFTREQAQYIQGMIDKSIDWLRLFIKLNVETKIADFKNEQDMLMQNLKTYTEENVMQLFADQAKNLKHVNEIYSSTKGLVKDLEEVQKQNKEDRSQIQQFKQRLSIDVKANTEKCDLRMDIF